MYVLGLFHRGVEKFKFWGLSSGILPLKIQIFICHEDNLKKLTIPE